MTMTDPIDSHTAQIVNIEDARNARTAREILASNWTPPMLLRD